MKLLYGIHFHQNTTQNHVNKTRTQLKSQTNIKRDKHIEKKKLPFTFSNIVAHTKGVQEKLHISNLPFFFAKHISNLLYFDTHQLRSLITNYFLKKTKTLL